MKSSISVIGLVPALTLFAAVDLAAQDELALEEIIVTAQKREQSLQEVPVSVTAISGDDINEGGITGMQDVAMATPNFTMTQFNIGEPQYFIRGIGTTLDSAGADPAVATFIDEVYIGRAGGSSMDLYDLQRVEVLRGPQGTLFGKNVVGGAISISTQKPSDEFIAKFGITAGNYDALAVRGLISGSISDNVNGSFSFSQRKRDGYVENVVDSIDYHDEDNISFRGQLAFAPSDSVDVRLVADHSKDDQAGNCRNVNNLSLNDPLMLAVVYPPVIDSTTGGDIRKCASSLGAFQDREINGLMARIDWDLANATLTSITAYRETDYQWSEDLAGMPLGLTPFNLIDAADEKSDQLSQEFRLTSTGDGNVDWLVGAFFMEENVDRAENFVGSFGPPIAAQGFALLDGDIIFAQDNKTTSTALYGQLNWRISDRFSWNIGGRFAKDDKKITQGLINLEDPAFDSALLSALLGVPVNLVILGIPANGPGELLAFIGSGDPSVLTVPYTADASDDWSEFVPSTSLNWQFGDNNLVYFTASKGYKSGAYVAQRTTAATAVVPLDPEFATNFELGLKTQFADNRVRLNASVFTMDYTDLQVFRLVGSLLVGASAEATSSGLEIDLTALASEDWVLSASYGYLDAEYDKFISGSDDFKGNKLPRSSEDSFSINSNYTFNLNGGSTIDWNVNYTQKGDYFIEVSNSDASKEDGYGLLNSSLAWMSADGNWEFVAWGKNITDEEFRTHSIISNIAGTVDLWNMPPTYGLTVNKTFQ
ncbi:MAG: TonB-dependent receptor [Gammaproteobacteria bacterium]|nr:TonB-dependent receptor [Gammaproteobacteria bacterium]MDH3409264.1 TonB-dependent receptor [Gammaproteobacteria bacterium]MDH3552307.1 TonB-dependent receptor [Gammaproteobacteria bacterium]